jgi:hypothetical protein
MSAVLIIKLCSFSCNRAAISIPRKPIVQARYANPAQFEAIRQSILSEFNGRNYDELAGKYHFTRRYIEGLITQSQTDASADPAHRSQRA